MSTELAVDLLGDTPGRVVLSEAPLVEGTVAAAASASGGASLDEVAAEARGALAMKTSQLGGADDARAGARRGAPSARRPTRRPCSRSATRSGCTRARRHGSSRPSGGSTPTCGWRRRRTAQPVKATSLTNVVALGARFGDTLVGHRVGACRPTTCLLALAQLADEGFGDGVGGRAAPAPLFQSAWLASQPGTRKRGDRGRAPGGRRRPHRCPRLGRARVRPRPPPARRHRPATGPRRRGPAPRTRTAEPRHRRRSHRDRARPRHGR